MHPGDAPVPSIPDFQLLRLIGSGSYGDVWLARGVTGVFRAVKIVWRARFNDPRPYAREFEGVTSFAAVSLREPSQLALLHAGRNDEAGFFYYVMELADDVTRGRDIDPNTYVPLTLRALSTRSDRMPVTDVVALGVALARALASLHATGLVHRDIKPSNIVLVGGVPKLADVGLVAAASAGLTFVGTEGFVPPEGPGAPAADVYSLGKVLYELATGLDRQDFPRLPPNLGDWPDRRALLELNEVLLRACEPVALHRFASAATFLDELLLLQAGKSVRRLRSAERRTARALRVAAGLALVASVAGVGAWVERQRANEELARRQQAEADRDEFRRKSEYSAGLARAQRALDTGDYGYSRILLRQLLPTAGLADLRSFEWQVLQGEARGDPAVVLSEAGPGVQRIRFSPDGRLFAAQNVNETVTLWDTASRRVSRRFEGMWRLAGWSSDNRWLVGVNPKGQLQRWPADADTPAPAPGRHVRLYSAVEPIGAERVIFLTSASTDEPAAARTYDFAAAAEINRFAPPKESGESWAFYRYGVAAASTDGRLVAMVSIAGSVLNPIWKLEVVDLPEKRIVFRETTNHRITALAFSPQATELAVAFGDTVEIGLLEVGRAAWTWKKNIGGSQTDILAYSPDGTRLAIGGREPLVRVIDRETGEIRRELRGHRAGIQDVTWSADGATLASTDSAGEIRLWLAPANSPSKFISGLWKLSGGGRVLCFAHDGALLAASDEPGKGALVVGATDLGPRARIPGPWLPVGFVPNAAEIVGIRNDGTMQRWSIGAATPRLVEELALFDEPTPVGSSAALSADAHILVVGNTRGKIAFWNLARRERLRVLNSGNESLHFVALAPDGDLALTGGSKTSHARLWRVSTGERRAMFGVSGAQPLCGAFSPSSQLFAIGWSDGTVEIRRSASGHLLHRIRTDSALVQSIVFSPDGQRIACGGPEGAIRVFATDDAREILTLRVELQGPNSLETTISSLAFPESGNALAAYLNDGRIRIWRF